MTLEARLITPFEKGGLVTYYKPWLIGDDAFPIIENMYLWRGQLKKREGFTLLGTLPTTPVQGLKNYIVPATANEQLIAFSTTKAYLWDTVGLTFNDISLNQFGATISWGGGVDDFFNASSYANSSWFTNGAQQNNAGAGAANNYIRYYNGTPTAGFVDHRPAVDATTTLDGALITIPYKGRLVTLNTTENGIRYRQRARWSQVGTPYAGSGPLLTITGITAANPAQITTSVAHNLTTGQSVYIFGVLGTMGPVLNNQSFVLTVTGANTFTVPVDTTALVYGGAGTAQGLGSPPLPFANDANAWRADIPGKGGFVDAPTSERLVAAAILRDILIVFFQRSTWRLRYTGSEILPFVWEQFNTLYGSESTHDVISFDEQLLTWSRYGFIGSTTNAVDRIDEKIPDKSFEVESGTGNLSDLQRIHGIRDFYRQMAYWTYPDSSANAQSPNRVLAYNYLTGTWSVFEQSFRCFGQYKTTFDITWANSANLTPPLAWDNSNFTWTSYSNQENAPYLLAGATNGNVYVVYDVQGVSQDNGTNFGFDVWTKRFNPYIEQGHRCRLVFADFYVNSEVEAEFTVELYMDDNPDLPVMTKRVQIDSKTRESRYVRVYFGSVGRVFQIRMFLSDSQLADDNSGTAQVTIQGIVIWTRKQGRLKTL